MPNTKPTAIAVVLVDESVSSPCVFAPADASPDGVDVELLDAGTDGEDDDDDDDAGEELEDGDEPADT